jgi:phage baseplate assembly protein W
MMKRAILVGMLLPNYLVNNCEYDMASVTVKFPLEKTGKNNGFDNIQTSDLKEVVKFNIKNTLLTCPGERTFDNEDYGVCLRKSLFEFPSNSNFNSLKSRIKKQLKVFVPYIVLQEITITNPEDMVMSVNLRYYINEIDINDFLEISVRP